jgi:hypothetical protein
MLSFTEKNSVYDFIPVEFDVHDVNGNTIQKTIKKIQSSQDTKLEYPILLISWDQQGQRYNGFFPSYLRQSSEEEYWLENIDVTKNYKVVIDGTTETFTITFTEMHLYKLSLFIAPKAGCTSNLKIQFKRKKTDEIVKEVILNNGLILAMTWTEILVNFFFYYNEDYDVILSEIPVGSNPIGFKIYTDLSSDIVYRISRKKSIEIYGGAETSVLVIECLTKDVHETTDEFSHGRSIGEEIINEVLKEIKTNWEENFGNHRIIDISTIQNSDEQHAGEYIYTSRVELTVLYENIYEKEEVYTKEVTIREFELI